MFGIEFILLTGFVGCFQVTPACSVCGATISRGMAIFGADSCIPRNSASRAWSSFSLFSRAASRWASSSSFFFRAL